MNDKTQLTERNDGDMTRRASEAPARLSSIIPPVDVIENSQGITLWADLPGVPREKLDVRVEGPNLYIEGEAVIPTPEQMRLQHAELQHPRFARAFTLSGDFDTARIEANLKDGVLRLSVPRWEEARPRRVEVAVG